MNNNQANPQGLNGHDSLIFDLMALLRDAARFHFHDFKSSDEAEESPKMALVKILDRIMRKAKNGHYDNKADDADKLNLKKILEEDGSLTPEQIQMILYGDH